MMESRNVEKIRLFDFGRTYGEGFSKQNFQNLILLNKIWKFEYLLSVEIEEGPAVAKTATGFGLL